MTALVHEVEQSSALSDKTKTTFLSSQDARLKRSAGLAKNYFQMDRATARLAFAGDEPGEDVAAWLRQNLPRDPSQHSDPGLQVFNSQVPGTPLTFLAIPSRRPQRSEKIAAFQLGPPDLRRC